MSSKGGGNLSVRGNSSRKASSSPRRASPSPSPSPSHKKKSQKPKDYRSDGVEDNDIFKLPASDWQLLGGLTVLAAIVRLFRIYQPTSVVFDEVHFGGFASKYIKGKFFMDVHPPLAKMLIALFGWLAGFDGEFDFKDIGKDYLEPAVPYVAMRMFPAICGVLTIPTMFLTLKTTGCRTMTAALGAVLIIFENGLLTNNRLILLDSPLVTATAFTALTWACFQNQQELGPSKAFTPLWWFWLVSTGFMLGITVSIKWVGLFTIGWVGSLTLVQLWVLLGDPKHVTPRLWFKHFCARAFCLLAIPIAFYVSMFAIHFLCLVNPGEGDGFMSSEFQATLNSKAMQDVAADVAFGSRISLRHHNTQGGYLHSHNHMYPEGSKQQQITLYPHKDENNVWLLENQTQPLGPDGKEIEGTQAWDANPPVWIEDGAVIKLYHAITHRRLHSHDHKAPVTEADWQKEVSCYGYEGFEGDANDMFRIEIIKDMCDGEEAKKRVRTIETKFKLVHIMSGCSLFSHKVKLPEWAYEQQEVTCATQGILANSVWYIEQNNHPQLGEDAEKVNYRNPGFLGKFFELNRVMWTTNAGLTDSHSWDSRPPSWPILKRGINFWGKEHRQIYLMGNPVIWLSSTAAVAAFIAIKGFSALRWQRGYNDYRNTEFKRFDYEIGTTVLGWAFHYLPFFLMARQLFLHHYFPALYFAIMAFCQFYDFVHYRSFGIKLNPKIGQVVAIGFIALSIFAFTMYAPLSYGNQWTRDSCKKTQLLSGWDWDCNLFLDSYDQYAHLEPAPSMDVPASRAPVAGEPFDMNPKAGVTQGQSGIPAFDEQGNRIVSREEKVEYRDEHGNLLNDEQVAALEHQNVKFETKYETRTRVVDVDGNELPEEEQQQLIKDEKLEQASSGGVIAEGIAPPHPDIEGRNPETAQAEMEGAPGGAADPEMSVGGRPPKVDVSSDEALEEVKQQQESLKSQQPRPASEGNVATAAQE